MNPVDRDRGLRVVGAVTSTVAAVSLIGIAATTALAAGETQQQDQLKAALSAQNGESGGSTATLAPAPATSTPRATSSKPRSTRAKVKATSTKRAADPADTGAGTGARAGAAEATKAASSPKPKKPAPAAQPTTAPPPVPSTGS